MNQKIKASRISTSILPAQRPAFISLNMQTEATHKMGWFRYEQFSLCLSKRK